MQLSATRMNASRSTRSSRGRTGTPDRGGIRKRGAPVRIDHDGDLDMGAGGGGGGGDKGRGGRHRLRGGRNAPEGRRPGGSGDRTVEALQKLISSNASSQANIRQPRKGGMANDGSGLSQLSIRGWKSSKAASNPGGALESLIGFIEKKATPDPRSPAADQRLKISKVCLTPPRSHGYRCISRGISTRFSSFQANYPYRRLRLPKLAAIFVG